MRSRLLACLALAVLAPLACAQTPLRPPTPLLAAPAETLSPGQAAVTLEAADRAQEMGFSSIKWYYGFMALRSERIAVYKVVAEL